MMNGRLVDIIALTEGTEFSFGERSSLFTVVAFDRIGWCGPLLVYVAGYGMPLTFCNDTHKVWVPYV